MESLDPPQTDRKLIRVIVWSSTLAVAGSLGLMFGFDNSGDEFRYQFTFNSIIAFIAGTVVMLYFWKKVFALLHDSQRLWRFLILCSVVVIVAFIGCVFLPQFRPAGADMSDLLGGMILGFLAVAAVFYFARVIMRFLEEADAESEKYR